ncbi:hypothetical protein Leryth_012128 [Lithospermum erythrorhizon]|nr:hypothetical protein Leryth_012128 [Lithospermum erythrorhizon]
MYAEETLHKSGRSDDDKIMMEQVKENDEDGNEIECVVCLNEVFKGEKYKILPTCKHGYHDSCIESWLQTNPSCPVCRCEVYMESGKQKGRVNGLISSLSSFFDGFCKPFFGFSTETIENSHYLL